VGTTEKAMQCANIFIVAFDNDDEAKEAKTSLAQRYSRRNVNEIIFSYQGEKVPCFLAKKPEAKAASGDTGIYVISHGLTLKGFLAEPLREPATRRAFVNWLLSLVEQKCSIRKLSFLTCCGIKSDFMEGTPETVMSAVEAKEADIFVQHMCQAISEIDTSRKLDGLMVAGYIYGVYVMKSGVKRSDRTDEDRYLMRPTPPPVAPVKPKKEKTELLKDWNKRLTQFQKDDSEYNKKMEIFKGRLPVYAQNKIVYVFKNGDWAFGKLSEYTDRAEWKATLSGAGL
jgi:hypothetical protein